MILASIMPTSMTVAPTDRSISPTIRMIVMAMERMPVIAEYCAMLMKLPSVRKFGVRTEKRIQTAIQTRIRIMADVTLNLLTAKKRWLFVSISYPST